MGRADDKEGEALLSEADEEKDQDTSEADEEKDQEKDNSDAEGSDGDSRKKYKCTQPGCNARFLRPSRLTWHLRKHNDERPYKCDQEGCDRAYTNSSHLKRHLNTTHKPVTKTYECQECGAEVGSLFSLKRHHKKIHDPQRLTCVECGAKFRKKHCYNEHLSMHAGVAMYKCEICNQNFAQLRLFKKHQRIHEPQKTYPCTSTGCTETFDKWTKLNKHLETEHEFDHSCDKCDKKFKSKKMLTTHQAVHDNAAIAKPCPYENCPRLYCYKKNLDDHILRTHLERKFYCDTCEKSFKIKRHLIKHIQVVHEGKKIPTTKRKKSRTRRKDAGVRKRSMATKLAGIKLPPELELRLLRRTPRIQLERLDEKRAHSSKQISEALSSSQTMIVDSETLNALEKFVENPSDRPERDKNEILSRLPSKLQSEKPPVVQGEYTGEAFDNFHCENRKISSDSMDVEENEKSIFIEECAKETVAICHRESDEETVSPLPSKTLIIADDNIDTPVEQSEQELLSSLLNDLENEAPMKVVEKSLVTSEQDDEAIRASLINDLEDDMPLANALLNEKPIVLAQYGEESLVASDTKYEEISRWLTTDSVEVTVPLIFIDTRK